MAGVPPLIMKLAMTVSPYPTFPRTRDNQRLGCGCLQPSRMASCFTQKGQTNRCASFTLRQIDALPHPRLARALFKYPHLNAFQPGILRQLDTLLNAPIILETKLELGIF